VDGVRYVLAEELRRLQDEGQASDAQTVIQPGEPVSFSGSELRHKFHFVSHLVSDRKELASVLKLKPGSLEGDPSLAGAWKAIRVELRGAVNGRTVNWIQQSLSQQLRSDQANFVCVWIDSPGGSPSDSLRLAHQLAELDSDQVRTVAFIPYEARADAALVGLACDHIVIQGDAVLGGPGAYQMGQREAQHARGPLRQLAKQKGRDWSLLTAMIDSQLTVSRYQRAGTGEVRYFCADELREQPDADRWQKQDDLRTSYGLSGHQALAVGLVRHLAGDWDEFKRLYDLQEEPQSLQPVWTDRWVEKLAEFLATPLVAGMLLFAAWFFLSAELSQPGIGAPGFIAALCFLLFFWSQFLNGTAGWLEVLLFAGGVVCVAIEIFVVPGVGVFGIGGAIMIIVSLVLASQSFVIPRNSYQLSQFPASLSVALAGIAGMIVALTMMPRLLRRAPYFNRLMLRPPQVDEMEQLGERESLVHWEHLVGKRGVTLTRLTPCGKARFGDDVVDVVSSGEPIPRDTDIYVTEVHGNRVLVRPVVSEDV
jgi:membrane-bound ClpP family serine protease